MKLAFGLSILLLFCFQNSISARSFNDVTYSNYLTNRASYDLLSKMENTSDFEFRVMLSVAGNTTEILHRLGSYLDILLITSMYPGRNFTSESVNFKDPFLRCYYREYIPLMSINSFESLMYRCNYQQNLNLRRRFAENYKFKRS